MFHDILSGLVTSLSLLFMMNDTGSNGNQTIALGNVTAAVTENNNTTMIAPQLLLSVNGNNGDGYKSSHIKPLRSCELADDDGSDDEFRVIGYYMNTARNRKFAEFIPRDIPTDYYTDIIYATFALNDEGLVKYTNPMVDLTLRGIDHTVSLRGQRRIKRVLYSIGGWNYSGSKRYKTYIK